jgi:nitrous oxide reductase accessory protein NosL
MKRLALAAFLLLSLVVVVACGGSASAEPTPPVIHYGEDICELCGMIISDERFAAGYITADGEDHIFDDIGNMFLAHLQTPSEVTAFFVHNYEDKRWIRAEQAYFVQSDEIVTPMLHGLAAVETAEKAEELAAEVNGRVWTFDQALTHFEEKAATGIEDHSQHQHQ